MNGAEIRRAARARVSPGELVDQLELLVRADPAFGGIAFPPIELQPRPEESGRANWAVGPFWNWEAGAQQRAALYRAIGRAKEQYDVVWWPEGQ